MRKLSLMLLTASAMTFNTAAIAADEKYESKVTVKKSEDGDWKQTSKTTHTDMDGTKTTSERKVDVDVNKDGSTDKTVKTEEVTDPKGLMNKETTKTKDEEKVAADGMVTTEHKKTVNGKTVEETKSDTTKSDTH